jgi:hypothetical protein
LLLSLSFFLGLIKQNTTQFPLPKDYKPCNACLPAFFVTLSLQQLLGIRVKRLYSLFEPPAAPSEGALFFFFELPQA